MVLGQTKPWLVRYTEINDMVIDHMQLLQHHLIGLSSDGIPHASIDGPLRRSKRIATSACSEESAFLLGLWKV